MSTTSFLAQFGSSEVLERMNCEFFFMFVKSLILKAAFKKKQKYGKMAEIFQQPLLQSSMSHDPQEKMSRIYLYYYYNYTFVYKILYL